MLWEWMPEILQRHGHQSPEHSSGRRGGRSNHGIERGRNEEGRGGGIRKGVEEEGGEKG